MPGALQRNIARHKAHVAAALDRLYPAVALADLTKAELMDRAAERGIEVKARMTKAEIVEALNEPQVSDGSDGSWADSASPAPEEPTE